MEQKLCKGILLDRKKLTIEYIWMENSYDFIIRAIDAIVLVPQELANGDTLYVQDHKMLIISDDLKTDIDVLRKKLAWSR